MKLKFEVYPERGLSYGQIGNTELVEQFEQLPNDSKGFMVVHSHDKLTI